VRLLSVVREHYYGNRSVTEPAFLYFTEPLRAMGHGVETFDHYAAGIRFGALRGAEVLRKQIQDGGYDVVFYQTSGSEPIEVSLLAPLAAKQLIVAWNSDDDWQWEGCTRHLAKNFSFMITTYPDIYEANRRRYPNLLLSQWGCYPIYADFSRTKDIEFSFVGQIYGARNQACRFLSKKVGLRYFGPGARLAALGLPHVRGILRFPFLAGRPVTFAQVHEIWNRSRISYTPMGAGPNCKMLQVKSRAFDMGLSGTLMLCELSPNLERYYDPGREFVPFENLEDCAEKARFYSQNEPERARIARRYRDRTLAEHLWEHRFAQLFREIGASSRSR
jgi:hypothetical protein